MSVEQMLNKYLVVAVLLVCICLSVATVCVWRREQTGQTGENTQIEGWISGYIWDSDPTTATEEYVDENVRIAFKPTKVKIRLVGDPIDGIKLKLDFPAQGWGPVYIGPTLDTSYDDNYSSSCGIVDNVKIVNGENFGIKYFLSIPVTPEGTFDPERYMYDHILSECILTLSVVDNAGVCISGSTKKVPNLWNENYPWGEGWGGMSVTFLSGDVTFSKNLGLYPFMRPPLE
jgi:hypothetical protein